MAQDPDGSVELTAVRHEFRADTLAAALRAEGITATVVGHASRLADGRIGGERITVMVRRGDLERAREVLRNLRVDPVHIDWDEVDVGNPVAEADVGAGTADEVSNRGPRGRDHRRDFSGRRGPHREAADAQDAVRAGWSPASGRPDPAPRAHARERTNVGMTIRPVARL